MEDAGSENGLITWLRLIRTNGMTPYRFSRLIRILGSPGRIIEADSSELQNCGLEPDAVQSLKFPDWRAIERDLDWIKRAGHHFIGILDSHYPSLLRQIHDPPLGLFVKGHTEVLHTLQVAIVGSRRPTPGGRRIAQDFAAELGAMRITITSGLATGIDSAAHQGALSSKGMTVAVLANGLDSVYPKSNTRLADQICEKGALVSELPLMTKPLAFNFPRRNRIISGLSAGTLIVEAALKSGSLITARMAMEQDREVFAVPGSIHNPLSRGCHKLLRDGAKLTESVRDIVDEIAHLHVPELFPREPAQEKQRSNQSLDEYGKLLLDNIGYDPVTIDRLVEETGISANVTAAVLLELELQNLIESLPGSSFIRKN